MTDNHWPRVAQYPPSGGAGRCMATWMTWKGHGAAHRLMRAAERTAELIEQPRPWLGEQARAEPIAGS